MYEYCDNAWLRFAIIIHKQILEKMDINVGYSTEQVANKIGLNEPRTRKLLNKLVDMELISL